MPVKYQYKIPKTLLNKGTGFLSSYSHSLNPYTGCSFACSYCYVRQMPVSLFRQEEWSTWVDVKKEAARVFKKEYQRAKAKGPITIFMSSSTDPYQPIEHKEQITRSLLEVIASDPPDFLLVQTRSPLVQRDIDLLLKLKHKVRVSMTVETDREDILKTFTPSAPPIAARLKTLHLLREAGVPTQVAIAPVLPSSEKFAETLAACVNRIVVDDFFMGDGSGGKRTQRLNVKSFYEKLGLEQWYDRSAYLTIVEHLRSYFAENQLFISKEGFEP